MYTLYIIFLFNRQNMQLLRKTQEFFLYICSLQLGEVLEIKLLYTLPQTYARQSPSRHTSLGYLR